MTFFIAQKQLIKLWFIWTMVLLIFVGYHLLFGIFKPIPKEVMTWFAKYLASIFALIIGSTFFSQKLFEEQLNDKIYFYLAIGTSVLYLVFITVVLVILPRTEGINSKEDYISQLKNMGLVFNFLLPILTGVLGYFFYKSKK
jgi:predicted MFS family arabinose efflux permease